MVGVSRGIIKIVCLHISTGIPKIIHIYVRALLLANDANNKGSAKKKLNTYRPYLLLLHFCPSSEEGEGE